LPKLLAEDQVASFRRDGFLGPIDLLTTGEAAEVRRRIEEVEAKTKSQIQKDFKIKAHLPFPWLCDIISHPVLLDAVEDIIGPDILCWGSSFFQKEAHDPGFVSWHQDSTYYGIEPPDTLTAWVAISESSLESGCIRFIPGSHDQGLYPHLELKAEDNLLTRGQTIEGIDEAAAVPVPLKAGQFSFHWEDTVHGSDPNNSGDRRIGLSIHYVAPTVRDAKYAGASAMLLRGTDDLGHWLHDPWPSEDWDPACLAVLDRSWKLYQSPPAGAATD
jgi:non-haem Fe2+, alpha-ketoglutarate-dependent halogenase